MGSASASRALLADAKKDAKAAAQSKAVAQSKDGKQSKDLIGKGALLDMVGGLLGKGGGGGAAPAPAPGPQPIYTAPAKTERVVVQQVRISRSPRRAFAARGGRERGACFVAPAACFVRPAPNLPPRARRPASAPQVPVPVPTPVPNPVPTPVEVQVRSASSFCPD